MPIGPDFQHASRVAMGIHSADLGKAARPAGWLLQSG